MINSIIIGHDDHKAVSKCNTDGKSVPLIGFRIPVGTSFHKTRTKICGLI